MSTFSWPSLAISLSGAFVINLLAQALDWSDGRTALTLGIFLLGLLFARNRVDRASVLLVATAELLFLAEPWVYWLSVPLVATGFAWWVTSSAFDTVASVQIRARPDRAIAVGAQSDVDRYLARDFSVVGSADATGRGFETIFTYLLGADRRTYAIATDQVRCLTSVFGSRILVTINRANLDVPPFELRQWIEEDSMTVTLDAHNRALSVLSQLGYVPDRVRPEDVVSFSIGVDEASMEHLLGNRWRHFWTSLRSSFGVRVPNSRHLADDEPTRKRVAEWMAS